MIKLFNFVLLLFLISCLTIDEIQSQGLVGQFQSTLGYLFWNVDKFSLTLSGKGDMFKVVPVNINTTVKPTEVTGGFTIQLQSTNQFIYRDSTGQLKIKAVCDSKIKENLEMENDCHWYKGYEQSKQIVKHVTTGTYWEAVNATQFAYVKVMNTDPTTQDFSFNIILPVASNVPVILPVASNVPATILHSPNGTTTG